MTDKNTDPNATVEPVRNFPGSDKPLKATLSPEEVSNRIASRVMGAGSLDELFDVWEGQASRDLAGRSFEIRSIEWGWYQADTGEIPLAVVDAVDLKTGEETTWPTTARNLVTFLWKAEEMDALPFEARIVGETTKSGRTVLRFARR